MVSFQTCRCVYSERCVVMRRVINTRQAIYELYMVGQRQRLSVQQRPWGPETMRVVLNSSRCNALNALSKHNLKTPVQPYNADVYTM